MSITIGQDSYVDVAYANTYLGRKVYTTEWDNSTEATREKALQEATFKIEQFKFDGLRATETQKLEFPRVSRLKDVGTLTVEVPEQIKYAVCEEALAIIKYGNSARTEAQRQSVFSVRIGDISESYGQSFSLLSPEARTLISPFKAGSVVITR